jgi:hypothetical protein
MKKTIMQSTVKVDEEYGVEIGDYAVIMESGAVISKPFAEVWLVESSQEGKIEVTEQGLLSAELVNSDGEWLEEAKRKLRESSGDPDIEFLSEGEGWFLGYNEEDQEATSPPSNVKVITANMSLDGKLGWEYFPGYYLLEGGVSYSPYSRPPIQKDKIEPAEGEFTVDYKRYYDATQDAEKLGFIAEAERLGIRGYID